jgi:pyruvate,water dikinase
MLTLDRRFQGGGTGLPSRDVSDVRWFAEIGAQDVQLVGGKAANLGELVAAGLPVPPGFVITTDAYRRHARGDEVPEPLRSEILAAYAELGDATPVAVRSSATAEDLAEASFAGQQETYLNVRGADDLLTAVRECWASLFTERAVAYRARQEVDETTVALAVVVQTMVEADAAGVMFTANPANGRRDQVAVNAAWGLGEAVVSGSVDADDLVVGVDPWVVRDRRTADKAVQVRYAAHRTEEVPTPADRRRVPVLDDAAALELARLGRRTQEHFGAPQDIEWVRSAAGFALVQSRPITALRPPEADPPTDWTVPHPKDFYARASIVEQLPDPLSPLFAELVDPSVTRSLVALMQEFVGSGVVRADDVGLPTVNGYAYYDYSRRGMLRLTANSWRAFPVLRPHGRRSGLVRWRDQAHPAYVATTAAWVAKDPAALSSAELLAGVTELLDAGTRYYTSVQTIIPMAATAEIIFSTVYDRLVRRHGDPPATTFLLGEDLVPGGPGAGRPAVHRGVGSGGGGVPGRRGPRRGRPGDLGGVRAPLPGAPGRVRAHGLQPRLPAPDGRRGARPARRRAAVRRARRRGGPQRAAAPVAPAARGRDRGGGAAPRAGSRPALPRSAARGPGDRSPA